MKAQRQGLDFNANGAELYNVAVPMSQNAPYATLLNRFGATYGTWDNLVGGKGTNVNTVCGGGVVDPGASAGQTAAQNSSLAFTPLMNTSTCNPWTWTDDFYLEFVPASQNSDPLAWALESSRYDLYHGQWAAQAVQAAGGGAIDYSTLKQKNSSPSFVDDGKYFADGELLWTDLSTGLKPFVFTQIQGLDPTPASKIVWMLSTQSGPFVNNCGVEYDARPGNTNAGTKTLLTFTAVDISPPPPDDSYYWPGWKGMKGQWYGPGSSATAGVLQQWATDQMLKTPSHDPDEPDGQIIVTGSTEDNFGVFADICVIERAWSRMAMDLLGQTLGTDGKPISQNGIAGVVPSEVNLGCYELAYIPLSWYNPAAALPSYPYYPS
jgi:hypothetical protein